MLRWTPIVLLIASSCGDSEGDPTAALEIGFSILRDGDAVECKDVDGIRAVEVSVLAADGLSSLPGYPMEADCELGVFEARGLAPAEYTLVVSARGSVVGDDDAVLYKARQSVKFPETSRTELALAPEVAFFDLSWSFEGEDASCEEVDRVDVFVSGGTAASAFSDDFACGASPIRISTPFAPRTYTVQVIASLEGAPIYRGTKELALAAGRNAFDIVLLPAGGRISFDWRFEIAGVLEHACDAESVLATEIRATVRSMLGDDPVVEAFACGAPRPYALRTARFTQGRQLEVELLAEGTHRFRSASSVSMPDGDLDLGLTTLRAVGNATVTLALSDTSSCSSTSLDRYELSVVEESTGEAWYEKDLAPLRTSVRLMHLPYGAYSIEAAGFDGSLALCRGTGQRTISSRDNAWPPIELAP
ncbi:MAG: hypothetical protein HYV07_01180 [Deltaproteobacteria bacterium]|nr:hypothetical protein [Deltaproteobacteria bacterium]